MGAAMSDVFGQGAYRVRFDWGPAGAAAIAPGAAFVVVVDVLSFTTALTVAVERGISVLPYPFRDDSAAEAARRHRATLAVGRSRAAPGQISLSPQSIARAPDGIERLVLPSPNGSAIVSGLAGTGLARAGVTVVGVCLRNAAAAAAWVRSRAGDRPVAVIAAGERHPDGSLRPAVEDLWGAGAFLAALVGDASDGATAGGASDRATAGGASDKATAGDPPDKATAGDPPDKATAGGASGGATVGGVSPEAGAAVAAYVALAGRPGAALRASVSGRELQVSGFSGDVEMAGALDVSEVVPVLRQGWFVDGGS